MENNTPKYPFSFFIIMDINNFQVRGYEMFPERFRINGCREKKSLRLIKSSFQIFQIDWKWARVIIVVADKIFLCIYLNDSAEWRLRKLSVTI